MEADAEQEIPIIAWKPFVFMSGALRVSSLISGAFVRGDMPAMSRRLARCGTCGTRIAIRPADMCQALKNSYLMRSINAAIIIVESIFAAFVLVLIRSRAGHSTHASV